MGILTDLANAHGTDKGTVAWAKWGYTEVYEEYFKHRRNDPLKLLEIGIRDVSFPGASIRMWYDYFPNATITGVDILDCSDFQNDRITTIRVDQADYVEMQNVGRIHGPFDIVVGDGDKNFIPTLYSIVALFPQFMAEGGEFWQEDLELHDQSKMIREVLIRMGAEILHDGKLARLVR